MNTIILSIFQKYKITKGEIYFKDAKSFKENGNYKKALKYLLKAHKVFSNIPKYHIISTVILNNIGDAFYNLQNYKKAMEYFNYAEKMIIDFNIKEQDLINKINRNLALCYKQVRNFGDFIKYILLCLEQEKDQVVKASIMIDLSHAYRILEEYKEALEYSNSALEIYEKEFTNDSYEVGNGNLTIALVYLDTQKYYEAISFLEKTEEIYENIVIPKAHLLNLYELMEYAFFNLGYKDTAVFYSGKYKKLLKN